MGQSFDQLDEYGSFADVMLFISKYIKRAEQTTDKRLFPILGIVTANNDPENRRRVKIVDPLFGGIIDSAWINPIRVTQNYDPPLPQINQMVIVWFVNGDNENGWYLPVMSDTNPSRNKVDAIADESYRVEGNRITTIDKDETSDIGGDLTTNVGGDADINLTGKVDADIQNNIDVRGEGTLLIDMAGQVVIRNDSGAFIQLGGNGIVTIQDAFGRRITLGGVGTGGEWNLNNLPLSIINATSITINSKQIATVGAVDNDGDTIVNKGW
jgi:hypothetical protein